MTNTEIDKILTEAMGNHEHRHAQPINNPDNLKRVDCYKCGEEVDWDDCYKSPTPTTNWNDYGEVLEWMKEQNLWQAFVQTIFDKAEHDDQLGDTANIFTNPETGSRAIAEFLQTEKEKVDE